MVVALKAKVMIEGVTRPYLINQHKAEFASLVVYLMTSVGKFRQSTEERNQLYLGRLGHAMKQAIPQITILYKNITKHEPRFIYKQEMVQGFPELIVGMSIILAFDNIIKSIQPALDYPIADDGFHQIVAECRLAIDNY